MEQNYTEDLDLDLHDVEDHQLIHHISGDDYELVMIDAILGSIFSNERSNIE